MTDHVIEHELADAKHPVDMPWPKACRLMVKSDIPVGYSRATNPCPDFHLGRPVRYPHYEVGERCGAHLAMVIIQAGV